MSLRHTLLALAAVATSATLVACHNDALPGAGESTDPVPVGDTVVLSASGKVLTFNRADLASLVSSVTIKGLASGEVLVAIDSRPALQKLYALSNLGNLYVLDDSTGNVSAKVALTANATTPINTTCTPAVTAFTALSGTEFGIDFNPAVDRLRITSDTGQNLRVNADDGMATVDCPLLAGTTSVKASAAGYINSVPGRGVQTTADPTSLFYVDASTDQLLTTTAPNGGALTAVGALTVDVQAINGFDVVSTVSGTTFTNSAFAVFTVGGVAGFYSVDTATGAATVRVNFPAGESLRGLALK